MPLITTVLRLNDSSSAVNELQMALMSYGVPIATEELATGAGNGRFGASTQSAVLAVRQRFGLPQPSADAPAFDASVARLLNVASWAALGNQTALRGAVKELLAAADGAQPQELYWLARYAVLAGDYTAADQAAKRAPDFAPMAATVAPVIAVPSPWPQQPEVTHPENFYSYRRPLVDPDAVERVFLDWPKLAPTDYTPPQGAAGPQAIAALRKWVEGNQYFDERRYAAAVAAHDACQDAVIGYFTRLYPTEITVPAGSRPEQVLGLFRALLKVRDRRPAFWELLRVRRELLSLAELEAHDTIMPGDSYDSAKNFIWHQMGNPTVWPDPIKDFRETNLDAPLMTLALVLVPLARAEANRLRRQHDAAISDLQMALHSQFVGWVGGIPLTAVYIHLACDFIEMPFARLLIAETMLDRAEAEYKARAPADPPPARDVAQFQKS